jgi:hypothetical protein
MLGAFFFGVAAALGHHLFYQSLNGHSVGKSLFEQQMNSDLGTGFAFLVRALFVIAIGTAHVQLLWKSFTAGPSTVGTIDSLFVQRSDATQLLNWGVVVKHPVLTLLALASWTMPFATIVPPGTLSVRLSPTQEHSFRSLRIPAVNFSSTSFAQMTGDELSLGAGGDTVYNGPQSLLSSISTQVATSGVMLSIPPPLYSTNLSYTMTYYGPALKCAEIPVTSIVEEVESVLT